MTQPGPGNLYPEPPEEGIDLTPFLVDGLSLKTAQEAGLLVEGWRARIREEGAPPELIEQVKAGLRSYSESFPNSTLWDFFRGGLAEEAFDRGHIRSALNLLYDTRANWQLGGMVTALALRDADPEIETRVFDMFWAGYIEEPTAPRTLEITQAIINRLIDENPASDQIEAHEERMRAAAPDYDPIGAWAESLDLDAATTKEIISSDMLWGDMPIAYRQHLHLVALAYQELLRQEVTTELIDSIGRNIATLERLTPGVPIWDALRGDHATLLIKLGYPGFALDLARAIREDVPKMDVIELMASDSENQPHDYGDEAIELALTLKQGDLLAAALGGDIVTWRNGERAKQVLQEFVADRSQASQQQLDALRYMATRCEMAGEVAEAATYEQMINALQAYLAETHELPDQGDAGPYTYYY